MIQAALLKQHMSPLMVENAVNSAMEQEYFDHYGLCFERSLKEISHRFGYIGSGDYRIACHLFQQPEAKGTWFVLHGYFDHTGMMPHIIRFFLTQGYDVLAYDLPGHGLSTGAAATIPDFSVYSVILEDIYNHCQEFLTQPCHAFGQSTGSAILTDFLNEKASHNKTLPFKQLILSAPLVRPYLWHLSRLQLYVLRPFLKEIPRKFSKNSRDEDFLRRAMNDPLAVRVLSTQWVTALDRWIRRIEVSSVQIPRSPLILQGSKDTTVDARHNIPMLHTLYTNPEVYWLQNARHHLPNELPETRIDYFEWLATRL